MHIYIYIYIYILFVERVRALAKRGGEGAADCDAVASSCSTGSCLSKV